jgi:hypothetical protein
VQLEVPGRAISFVSGARNPSPIQMSALLTFFNSKVSFTDSPRRYSFLSSVAVSASTGFLSGTGAASDSATQNVASMVQSSQESG